MSSISGLQKLVDRYESLAGQGGEIPDRDLARLRALEGEIASEWEAFQGQSDALVEYARGAKTPSELENVDRMKAFLGKAGGQLYRTFKRIQQVHDSAPDKLKRVRIEMVRLKDRLIKAEKEAARGKQTAASDAPGEQRKSTREGTEQAEQRKEAQLA